MAQGSNFMPQGGVLSMIDPINIGITLPSGKIPYGNFKIVSQRGNQYWWVRNGCSNYNFMQYGIYLEDLYGHSVLEVNENLNTCVIITVTKF